MIREGMVIDELSRGMMPESPAALGLRQTGAPQSEPANKDNDEQKSMKTLALVIALTAFLGLLAYTNPSMDDFSNYVRQHVQKEFQEDANEPLGQMFGSIMGGIAGGLVAGQTIKNDYVLFSTYELQFGKKQLKALGILRNFVLLEKPDLKRQKAREHGPE
jgi:hypothetical protein